VREALVKRGATTIRGLGRTFRALDSYDGNRKVDGGEFFVGLQEHGVKLSKTESDVSHFLENCIFQALLSYFDTDGDGCINFDEFLIGIRVSPCFQQSFVGSYEREATSHG